MNAYQKFLKKELILRDKLAVDRTLLASERTFLAYIRTSLTLILAGATIAKFFNELYFIILGLLSVVVGIGIFYFGYIRHKKFQQSVIVFNEIGERE